MKILLTGSTGLLGKSLIECLDKKHEIFCLIRNKSKFSFKELTHVNFLEQDLAQPLDFSKFPKKIDAIIHLAQSLQYKNFLTCAEDIFSINTYSTFQLMEYARKAKADYFLYTSTGSVYEDNYNATSEDEKLSPFSFYPSTKLASEILLNSYKDFFKICIFRLFFLYGQHQKEDRILFRIYNNIKSGTPIHIDSGEGLEFTPTYCCDVAHIINKALIEKWQGCFNVASPEVVTIKEVALKIGDLIGKSPLLEYSKNTPKISIVPNLMRLKKIYPEMNFINLDKGLKKTFETEKISCVF